MDRTDMTASATRPRARTVHLLFMAIMIQHFGRVFSNEIGATIIESRWGWVAVEGANVTLDCQKHGQSSSTVCNYIAFTRNRSVIPTDTRHRRSGPTWMSLSLVNCTMTITELTVNDSGFYGCCWGTDSCTHHVVKNLTVLPLTTTGPTTTMLPSTKKLTTKTTTTSKMVRSSESNDIVYHSVAPADGNQVGQNDAQTGNSSQAIHKTVWPLLLVVVVILILVYIGMKYYKGRKTNDALPEDDHEHDVENQVESNMMMATGSADDVSCISNGVITTTTTTTTVMKAAS